MSPRLGSGLGLRGRRSQNIFSPLDMSGCQLWLRGDLGVTLASGKVSAWANQGLLGGSVAQGTAAKQPIMGALNGRDAIACDGSDDVLVYDGAKGDFKFLHDGTGATTFTVLHWDAAAAGGDYPFATANSTGAIGTYHYNSGDRAYARVENGGGSNVIIIATSANSWNTGESHVETTAYQEGAATEFQIWLDGVLEASANSTLVPSAADPTYPLAIGNSRDGATAGWLGEIAEVIAYDRLLSDTERTTVESYLKERYWPPINSPLDLPGCQLWLRGDLGVTLASGKVSAWANQGILGGSVAQGTAAEQPTMGTLNARDAIALDGTDDRLQYDGAAGDFKFLHDGTGCTVLLAGYRDPADANATWWASTDAANKNNVGIDLLFAGLTAVGGRIANGTGAWLVLTSAVGWAKGDAHVEAMRYGEGAAPEYEVRLDGAQVISAATTAAPSVANPTQALVIGNYTPSGVGLPVHGLLAEMIAYDRRLSDVDLARVESYLTRRYQL